MTKFQAGTIRTSQVMDCQVHAIGKAGPLFADPVTFIFKVNIGICTVLISVAVHYHSGAM